MQTRLATRGSLAYWGALVLSISLAACGSPASSPENPDQGGGGPSDDAPQMLVLGDVQSPVFDELKTELRVVNYDGSQSARDYSGVIFDGDDLTPEETGSDPLIRDALIAEKWVIALDATAAHKQEAGLAKYLAFSSNFDSPAYLVHRGLDTSAHLYADIIEYPAASVTVTPNAEVPRTATKSKVTKQASEAFTKRVISAIKGETLEAQQSNTGPTNPVNNGPQPFPSGLPYFQISYNPPYQPWTILGARKASSTPQNMGFEMTYHFYVFLNNQDTATSYQYVVAEITAVATPSTDAGSTPGQYVFADMSDTEKAWWQDQVVINIKPDNSSNFTSPEASPNTPNNQSQVTSGNSINVSYQGGPSGGYTYSNSTTYDLPDWTSTNEIVENDITWNFYSANPDATQPYWCSNPFECNGYNLTQYFPNQPSDLSMNTSQFYAQAIWQTPSGTVLDDSEQFDLYASHRVADTFCLHTVVNLHCDGAGNTNYLTGIHEIAWDTDINMAASIPNSIASITFEPASATAGDMVTGTVTLTDPAQIETSIAVSTDGPNATIETSPVSVPVGETSTTFEVETDGTGLPEGGVTATITATYNTSSKNGLLSITAPQ